MLGQQTYNKRIAKNTILLYIRMLFSMIVGLYTVRAIIKILGVEDFGIYNVVAGTVTSFSFLSSTTVSAIQRFLSFSLGKNDMTSYLKYFKSSLYIFIFISIISFLLANTIGLWFVANYLVIPTERFTAALWVYESCIVLLVSSFITVPYNAIIVSNERMNYYACISIVDVVLKLLVVLLLPIIKLDQLIAYAILLMCIGLFNICVYRYCAGIVMPLIKEEIEYGRLYTAKILGFTSWNIFGSLSGLARGQGINILINIFFGPTMNAAYGIAYQIYNAVKSYCSNFMMAVNPQIIKLYAKNEKNEWMCLVIRSSKISFGLLLVISFPLFCVMPQILDLWLVDYPLITVLFTRLVFINMLVECLSQPLLTLAQATGNVKIYQLIVGGTLILNLPISYIAFRIFSQPELCFYIIILFNIIALVLRLLILKKSAGMDVNKFLNDSVFRCVYVLLFVVIFCYIILPIENVYDVVELVLSFGVLSVLEFYLLFTQHERVRIVNIIRHKMRL